MCLPDLNLSPCLDESSSRVLERCVTSIGAGIVCLVERVGALFGVSLPLPQWTSVCGRLLLARGKATEEAVKIEGGLIYWGVLDEFVPRVQIYQLINWFRWVIILLRGPNILRNFWYICSQGP